MGEPFRKCRRCGEILADDEGAICDACHDEAYVPPSARQEQTEDEDDETDGDE